MLNWITSGVSPVMGALFHIIGLKKIKEIVMSNCQWNNGFLYFKNCLNIREAIIATESCHFCFEMCAVLMLDDMVAP